MKRKILLTTLLVLSLVLPSWAADPGNYVRDYEDITVSTTAVGLSPSKVAKMNPANNTKGGTTQVWILLGVESANIRWRIDGTNPTATVGDLRYVGETIKLDDYYDAVNLRMIRDTAATGDATVHVIYKAVR